MPRITVILFTLVSLHVVQAQSVSKPGTLVTENLSSKILQENKIGLNTERPVIVYLPAGYATSKKSYPVVYYLHSGKPTEVISPGNVLNQLLDRGIAQGLTRDFIVVVADYSANGFGSFYENSIVSGRWLDFTVQELVPFIDGKFRTIRNRDSRAVVGHFFGGRGALKLGMVHAETFSVVYAMHPVATGIGALPWLALPIDWKKIYAARTVADAPTTGASPIFIRVCQAFLPNLNRPPFYCDFYMEPDADGKPKLNPDNMVKAKRGFHLEETLSESAANLRTLRGLFIDWAHFDGTEAHVFSARNFSRDLEDLGVDHEAEEYRGDPFTKIWTDDGRFYTRVLPFLNSRLVFEK